MDEVARKLIKKMAEDIRGEIAASSANGATLFGYPIVMEDNDAILVAASSLAAAKAAKQSTQDERTAAEFDRRATGLGVYRDR